LLSFSRRKGKQISAVYSPRSDPQKQPKLTTTLRLRETLGERERSGVVVVVVVVVNNTNSTIPAAFASSPLPPAALPLPPSRIPRLPPPLLAPLPALRLDLGPAAAAFVVGTLRRREVAESCDGCGPVVGAAEDVDGCDGLLEGHDGRGGKGRGERRGRERGRKRGRRA
jgi:hypothetical protein